MLSVTFNRSLLQTARPRELVESLSTSSTSILPWGYKRIPFNQSTNPRRPGGLTYNSSLELSSSLRHNSTHTNPTTYKLRPPRSFHF